MCSSDLTGGARGQEVHLSFNSRERGVAVELTVAAGRTLALILTVGAYWIGLKIQSKTKKVYFNPLLIAMLLCISILKVSRISYDTYMIGAQYISIWMTPATVALMTLVYRNRVLLKKNLVPVLAGILAGACASLSIVWLLCRLFRTTDRKSVV